MMDRFKSNLSIFICLTSTKCKSRKNVMLN